MENSDGDAVSSSSSTPPVTTSRTTKKRQKAPEIIITSLGDAALWVYIESDDDLARMLKLLNARYVSNQTMFHIAV